MPAIPPCKPALLSGADSFGVLHTGSGRYLRGLSDAGAATYADLRASGLLDSLESQGLIPKTTLLTGSVPEELSHFACVLEHEPIDPVTYPREWTFGMLKAAAQTYLALVLEARRFGFICKDAHLFNFVFRGVRPVWVDIGSFQRSGTMVADLPWLGEFRRAVLAPLRMWAAGAPSLARGAVRHPAGLVPYEEFVAWRMPFLRGSSPALARARRLVRLIGEANGVNGTSFAARSLRLLFARRPDRILQSLAKSIGRLECGATSPWAAYHEEYLDQAGRIRLPERFVRILELLDQYKPQRILELAGNSGVLSQAIAERYPQQPVICTDYDPAAIDGLFQRMRTSPVPNLSFAVLDFMVPEYARGELPPEERFRSDCVLALAVTHHLLLSQGYSHDSVFSAIRAYTRDLVFIEFMPLGLHDGNSAPAVPAWYSQAAFGEAFSHHFETLQIEALEENRVLFVGRVPHNRADMIEAPCPDK